MSRAILGYIPSLIVAAPFLITWLRQALFFEGGGADGISFFLIAALAFIIGGLLNLAYLGFILTRGEAFHRTLNPKETGIAQAGVLVAVMMAFAQLTFMMLCMFT